MDEIRWVIAHLATGNAPALVTRENEDGTLSLVVFIPGDVLQRHNVPEYIPEADDEPQDKVGFWSKSV
jgi:hypothetical protein